MSQEQQTEGGNPETPKGESKLDIGGEVRVSRLNTVVHCRAELARLYRESRKRHGKYPDALVATRLATILGEVRSLIEIADLDRRLRALEEKR